MALPTSPPISLNQIKAEFGATGTRSITEFYRGGPFVPNSPANASVPTSGAISILDFLGAGNLPPAVIALSNRVVVANDSLPAGWATAQYRLTRDGQAWISAANSMFPQVDTPISGEWGTGVSPNEYEVLRTNGAGGALVSGPAAGTWHLLGDRAWSLNRSTPGLVTGVINLQIRKVGTTTVLASASITLQASVGDL